MFLKLGWSQASEVSLNLESLHGDSQKRALGGPLKRLNATLSLLHFLDLRSRLFCTDPKSGLRPEMGKNGRNMHGFWPHWEKRGKMAEKPVGPKSILRPFFPHFVPEAGFGVNRDCNSGPLWKPLGDRECDWEALSRPISHPRTGRSSQPPRSKPLRKLNRAIVVL